MRTVFTTSNPRTGLKQASESGSSDRQQQSASYMSADLEVEGDVRATGFVEFHGRITGSVSVGKASVSSEAQIMGDIKASDIVINGRIDGTITAGRVALEKSAFVFGRIIYESLSVKPGAVVEGELFLKSRDDRGR
jgi:cytoskeletal protein CcmA (bactofilin family)